MIQFVKLKKAREHLIIFCDLSRAFDHVWNEGLLFKLKQYGMKEISLQCFANYLTDSQQKVHVAVSFSSFSSCQTILLNADVPQGSVLGPLLFSIYVNDITEQLYSFSRLFADDSSNLSSP